jgi:hypothetical protein
MPYLGPSLNEIAEDPNVTLDQKIIMCIKFFEHIASEYKLYASENPNSSTLGFYDIKPHNFSFDINGTQKCVQNDTKAKNCDPERHTKRYLAPWLDKVPLRNSTKSIPARDLYAMGQSVMEIFRQDRICKKNSKPLEKLQRFYLEKIANDMISYAQKNQNNNNLDNRDHIEKTIIPSLNTIQTQGDALFTFAVIYLAQNKTPIDAEKQAAIEADPEKKNIFTCAVFGAKAYLDQPQIKNDKTIGKWAVKRFLTRLVKIEPVSAEQTDSYKDNVYKEINKSVKASHFFSRNSRRAIFNTYCPKNDSFSPQENQIDHMYQATQKRIDNLVKLDDDTKDRLTNIFLSNNNKDLRFKVLEKAIQYLECSKAGWFGKKSVRNLIKSLSGDDRINDEVIIDEVHLTVNDYVFFKGVNKTRRAFFGEFVPQPKAVGHG